MKGDIQMEIIATKLESKNPIIAWAVIGIYLIVAGWGCNQIS
jgi:hypothetical protein